MDGEPLATTVESSIKKLELVRRLNGWHATAIVVGTIIGSGIFLVPSEMMQAVGSARMVYAVWIVGGILSFFGALTYSELGAMKPQAGGEYVFIRDAIARRADSSMRGHGSLLPNQPRLRAYRPELCSCSETFEGLDFPPRQRFVWA
jgi:Amino acid permease